MIVWIVNPFDPIPGEGMRPGRYHVLAEVLSDRGHDVVWWTSDYSHIFKRRRKPHIADLAKFQARRIRTLPYQSHIGFARLVNHRQFGTRFFSEAAKCLETGILYPPDRIVVSLPPLSSPISALKLRDRFGGKVVLDIQDAWPEAFFRFVPGRGKLSRLIAKCLFFPWYAQARKAYAGADAVSAVARTYLDLSGVKKRKIPTHVTFLGTDLPKLRANWKSQERPHRIVTFVYCGSMGANYDLETVIRASATFAERGYRFKVSMAGGGPDEARLQKLARSLIPSGNAFNEIVEFHGFLEFGDLAKLLGKADVAINPVSSDSYCAMPNKIADYFGAGLPAINSIPGELSDLIRKHDCGVDYIPGNPDSLAEAMSAYANDPDLISRQGKNASILAERLFDKTKTYPIWAEFVETLCGNV